MKNLTLKIFFILLLVSAAFFFAGKLQRENRILKQIIERLSADSRVAEVMVTGVREEGGRIITTIKFLEYDAMGRPMAPRYFTFPENIIHFQALVIRFDDFYVRRGHPLKGKSAYIFLKAFTLGLDGVRIHEINRSGEIPSGYAVDAVHSVFEKRLWKRFWKYALEPEEARRAGIKNAQLEAPGTKFVPGLLYTLKIEHDGGLRIDTQRLPSILNGEKVEFSH